MKLLLSSFGPGPAHDTELVNLAGKPLAEIRVGYIERMTPTTTRDRWRTGGLTSGTPDTPLTSSICASGETTGPASGTFSPDSMRSSSRAATRITSDH